MLAFATGKLQYNCVTLRLHFTKHVTQLTASSFVIVRFFRNSITMAIWNITKQLGVNVTLLMDIPVHYIADVERGEDVRHRHLSQPKPSVIFVLLNDTQFSTTMWSQLSSHGHIGGHSDPGHSYFRFPALWILPLPPCLPLRPLRPSIMVLCSCSIRMNSRDLWDAIQCKSFKKSS